LRLNLGDRVHIEVPDGGLALWLEPDASVDIEAWLTRALEAGVAFLPSTRVSWPGIDGRRGLRVGFSGHEPFQLDEIAQRLGQSLMDQD
jgi:DNA-binding transcriptional MocR family regulator